MKRSRDLTIAKLNVLDLNDKLGLLSGLVQYLDGQGRYAISDALGVAFYTPQLAPTIVAANSESTQTFTVTGMSVGDAVIVIKPTKQAGLSLFDFFVSTANTLSITFRNFTGAGITPTANERYIVVGFRAG